MKRSRPFKLFIAVNGLLCFWHIFRYTLILNARHQVQQVTNEYRCATERQQELTKVLCALRSPQVIHEFARHHEMHTMRLNQIHTVDHGSASV